MPVLKNNKYEIIAQGLARGLSNEKAVGEAGFTANRGNGWSIINKHPEILERVAEIKQEMAERNNITLDNIIEQLREDRQLAIDTNKAAAAVSATMGMAKLLGLEVTKSQVELSNPDGSLAMPREIRVVGVKPE